MISYKKVNAILQTLPVAYYLKRKLDVSLGHSETSYFEMMNDKLVVSYPQVARLDEPTEEDIRCVLYHEVSHALLTPRELKIDDVFNIFEDERIETICKDFYLGVDFKNFCKKINHFSKDIQPTTARDYFYFVVRFRVGEKKFVDRVDEIIKKYAHINYFSVVGRGYDTEVNYYNDEVHEFYNEVKEWFDKKKEEEEAILTDRDEHTTENKKEDSTNGEHAISSDGVEANKLSETLKEALTNSIKTLNNNFDNMTDVNMQNELRQLLLNKHKTSKLNGSAINGYSGTFDDRSVIRNDYKYFVKQNRAGNVKRFSKIKMNLFIDTSGSFRKSKGVVNKLLYNLAKLEKQTSDFSFDVVSMSMSEKLLAKDKREIDPYGGNRLDDKIFDIYNQLQDKQSENINIVLFDGDAFTDCYGSLREFHKNMGAFNHKNCIIISDISNSEPINKYCIQAKKVLVKENYATLLIENVMNNLHNSFR